MAAPWLSVITVVKDDSAGLTRTVNSLLAQDRSGVEFVLIDSSAARADAETIAAPAAGRVTWVPPRGIYPAMNEGLRHATGDLVLFLNAGDVLASPEVLAQVRPLLAGCVWGFGDVAIVSADGRRIVPPPMDYQAEQRACFARGRFPGHQGTFAARSSLLDAGGFDERYAIAADYAMFLRLSRMADPVMLDLTIAEFHEGGASTLRWRTSFREFHRARREILRPRGVVAMREVADTLLHYARVSAYRGLVAPMRGRG